MSLKTPDTFEVLHQPNESGRICVGIIEIRVATNPGARLRLMTKKIRDCLKRIGFFPFANESDGSVWLATVANGPSGKIYVLEHSDWDGSLPTKENGLIYAHKSLAHLLSAMAVDNQSFEKMEDCMWGKFA